MKGDKAIEEQGFSIVEPKRRASRAKVATTSRVPPACVASDTNRIRVTYLKRRHEVLVSATFYQSGRIMAHEVFSIHLGKLLKELGLTPMLIADARLQQRVRDECIGRMDSEPDDDEEEVVVVH